MWNEHIAKEDLDTIDLSFAYCTNPQYVLDTVFQNKLKAKYISVNLDSCKIGEKGLAQVLSNIDEAAL